MTAATDASAAPARRRNVALALACSLGFVVLVFVVTIVRLGGLPDAATESPADAVTAAGLCVVGGRRP